ncbi:hypothetical protein A3D05_05390 [Candidatus Gottesmanbacteria bacterium RIFCSPHIGHO2_02_FULL_40_24]|uniref:Uncharacterized protein n=1 Tax=Candidatus Gottesmanbacteria bacterium RIFCSPHIGHO2_01_FULL_40_15 TaxID=1798376 RepID=A0A1F5Z7N2_9BACT|nr:MAG: hypothetical protein A2777_02025 [Candidatus Gottesmanbacteria bacterium RIFCSPHIGHO2_01_FULL_40_15]OGG16464.1 MAG: hypothetical protein A3D05_05390 [Candidatus Gottesmanbacteria bacterium RIFCSPHIGHO2_02_FULL_40_24]OGG22744.1 MAG: hypothetical protein A3B48_03020 [Candidatus Gottesmanbacteria bacterium RIFCSPLOWO2_01_FULL_40_10]OGG25577.1 MAG: hypothetical protein A3E42_04540 [Candidatus Gottesmanbacteria bacterium RIFCSPHIGHO2_12_FULL_40_13]OGG32583.1 MAG: hypothetical protein A3I80_0
MRFFQTVLIAAVLFFLPLNNRTVFGAKKFIPKKGNAKSVNTASIIPVRVKYRADKRAIIFNFTGFSNITSASYLFSYLSNGITQGAAGTISSENDPSSPRELLFGTCSTSVCTFHTGLSKAGLNITVTMSNGKKISKNYRIKTYF